MTPFVGGAIADGVRGVDDGLAVDRVAAERDGFLGGLALHGQDDDLAELRRLAERSGVRLGPRALLPRGELRRVARAAHHVVPVLQEAVRERLPYLTRPDDADFAHGESVRCTESRRCFAERAVRL